MGKRVGVSERDVIRVIKTRILRHRRHKGCVVKIRESKTGILWNVEWKCKRK